LNVKRVALSVAVIVMAAWVPMLGSVAMAGTTSCPKLRIGKQACFAPTGLVTAESRTPFVPLLPSAYVYRAGNLRLRNVVVIRGAGRWATSHDPVDAIVYIYGSPPVDSSGHLEMSWPKSPKAIVIEELAGKVFTRDLTLSAYDPLVQTPTWGPWQLQTSLRKRPAAVDIISNISHPEIKSLTAGLLYADRGNRPVIQAPACYPVKDRHPLSIELDHARPGQKYQFVLKPRTRGQGRHRKLGVHQAGASGKVSITTTALRGRTRTGHWVVKAKKVGTHKTLSVSVHAKAGRCNLPAELTVTSPVALDSWVAHDRYDITWNSSDLSGHVGMTVTGPMRSGTKIHTVLKAHSVKVARGHYAWRVPAGWKPGWYVLSVSAKHKSKTISGKSGRFYLNG
jgi:hypothetical protein